jgi:hypothetical protein
MPQLHYTLHVPYKPRIDIFYGLCSFQLSNESVPLKWQKYYNLIRTENVTKTEFKDGECQLFLCGPV